MSASPPPAAAAAPADPADQPTPTPNILAQRYASEPMRRIWAPSEKVRRERLLWVAVMQAQRELGMAIPKKSITASAAKVNQIDLAAIAEREAQTRHDLKARIEEFCALSGHEHIHLGMTSRDITENIEQSQLRDSLLVLRAKAIAVLATITELATQHANTLVAARTHNVVAQTTTFGKRLATCGEELMMALEALEALLEGMRLRGIKGAVGTQQDLLQLFEGDHQKVAELEKRIAQHLDFERLHTASAQVSPRSFELAFVSLLVQLVSGPASLAVTLRLMAGHGHVAEGFADGQVGSSAMPHKNNPRLCERVGGLKTVLAGYLAMASELAGQQWNEGDVSCSVVRRVMLPDACYACDGLLDTFLAVLEDLEVSEESLREEARDRLLELSSSSLLSEAVAAGIGREVAHTLLSRHIRSIKNASAEEFAKKLGDDEIFPMTEPQVLDLLEKAFLPGGAAAHQVEQFTHQANTWLKEYSAAAKYDPPDPV